MGNPIVREQEKARRGDAVYVQLRVRDARSRASSADVYFKMKRRMPLGLLQEAYCQREKLEHSMLRFLYDGRNVHPSQTPEELDMEPVVTLVVEHALPGGGELPRSLPQAVGA